jgi:hypothetical protein
MGPGLPQKLLPAKVSSYCFFRFRDKSLLQGGVVSPTLILSSTTNIVYRMALNKQIINQLGFQSMGTSVSVSLSVSESMVYSVDESVSGPWINESVKRKWQRLWEVRTNSERPSLASVKHKISLSYYPHETWTYFLRWNGELSGFVTWAILKLSNWRVS